MRVGGYDCADMESLTSKYRPHPVAPGGDQWRSALLQAVAGQQ